jgi:tetratricopeptide (TPR) repeat protein
VAGALLFVVVTAAAGPSPTAEPVSSWELYRAGEVSRARAQARRELARSQAQGRPVEIWAHLMHVAWLEESLGEHKAALRYANRALDLASDIGDAFRIGRSLCWIGWSYTSLGLYELALAFYAQAIELATRGDRITIVPVWGLASQETGAILARMGRLTEAAERITETTEFARRRGIDVGVAEGAAHLAAIAIERGDLDRAEALAEEALSASLHCDCSAFNTARALTVVARVAVERAQRNPRFRGDATDKLERAMDHARRYGDRRHIAEGRVLRSRVVDPDDFERRVELVASALELLIAMESELRGTAEAQLGSLFLEAELDELAEGYLRNGLELNRKLFRRLDTAYVLADLAELDAGRSDAERTLSRLGEAAARAEQAGALPLLADTRERLAEELHGLGFTLLSRQWAELALATLEQLLALERDEESRRVLLARKLRLAERVADAELALRRSPAPPRE